MKRFSALVAALVAAVLSCAVLIAGPGAPMAQAVVSVPAVPVPASILTGAAETGAVTVGSGTAGAGIAVTGAGTVGLFVAGVVGYEAGNKVIGPWLFSQFGISTGQASVQVPIDTSSAWPTMAWTTRPIEDPQCAAINCRTMAWSTSLSRNTAVFYNFDINTTPGACANGIIVATGQLCGISAGGGVGTSHSVTYPGTGETGTGSTAPKLMSVTVSCYNAAGTVAIVCGYVKFRVSPKFTVTCRAAGGVTASGTTTLPTFRPGVDPTPTTTLPGCNTILPNSHVDSVTATEVLPGSGGTPTDVPFGTFKTFPDNVNTSGSTYADCTYSSGGTPCLVKLYKLTGGSFHACGSAGVDCTGWKSDVVANPTHFECRWGSHVMPITDCDFYPDSEAAAEPGATPTPTPTGTADPYATHGTNTDPRTGTDGDPDSTTGPAADAPDEAGHACMGDFWSWNPVNWVYIPIKCAMVWTFVPPEGTWEDTIGDGIDVWSATGYGEWATGIGGAVASLAGMDDYAGGCTGPVLNDTLPGGTEFTLKPLDACTDPMANVAHVTKVLLTLIIGFGGAFLIVDPIFKALGIGEIKHWEQGSLF